MKALFTTVFVVIVTTVFAQSVEVQQPIEQQYRVSSWWWLLGVIIALVLGACVYLLMKKNPRKDAV